jgi:hypothetical protein
VSLGFVNLLSMLIKLKYLSNLDNFDKSIINLASERDQKEAVKLLIANDVDLSRTCPDGQLYTRPLCGTTMICSKFY